MISIGILQNSIYRSFLIPVGTTGGRGGTARVRPH